MEQLLCEDLTPGVVVFGRVNSFPWWPAIVGRCPTSGEWADSQERRWVFFFNDHSGAWLKIRDMRPFTEWTRETMSEINKGNPKYRKHLDSIGGASVLALEYMRSPVIPRPLSEYNDKLTYAALDMEPPAEPVSGSAVNVQTAPRPLHMDNGNPIIGNESGLPKSSKRRRTTNVQAERNQGSINTAIVADSTQLDIDAGQRPRRRRKKSTRYEGFNNPFMIDARNGKLKDAQNIFIGNRKTVSSAQASAGEMEELSDTAQGLSIAPRVLLTLPLNGLLQNKSIAEWKRNGNTTAAIKSFSSLDEKMDVVQQPVGKAVTINKSNPLQIRINGAALHSNQKLESSSPKIGKKRVKPIAEDLLGSKNKQPNGIPSSGKKRSHSQTSSRSDEDEIDNKILIERSQATRSKNKMNDSQIAHPLVEDTASSSKETNKHVELPTELGDNSAAVRAASADEQTSTGSLARDASTAVGATAPSHESMYELNHRMRALEGHIQSLQVRVGRGRNVVSGENASAAALKTAVHNMARAAHAFARSRGFETLTIAAGIDSLWPQPVTNAKGAQAAKEGRQAEFVRSVAKSIVWAVAEQNTRI